MTLEAGVGGAAGDGGGGSVWEEWLREDVGWVGWRPGGGGEGYITGRRERSLGEGGLNW